MAYPQQIGGMYELSHYIRQLVAERTELEIRLFEKRREIAGQPMPGNWMSAHTEDGDSVEYTPFINPRLKELFFISEAGGYVGEKYPVTKQYVDAIMELEDFFSVAYEYCNPSDIPVLNAFLGTEYGRFLLRSGKRETVHPLELARAAALPGTLSTSGGEEGEEGEVVSARRMR